MLIPWHSHCGNILENSKLNKQFGHAGRKRYRQEFHTDVNDPNSCLSTIVTLFRFDLKHTFLIINFVTFRLF